MAHLNPRLTEFLGARNMKPNSVIFVAIRIGALYIASFSSQSLVPFPLYFFYSLFFSSVNSGRATLTQPPLVKDRKPTLSPAPLLQSPIALEEEVLCH